MPREFRKDAAKTLVTGTYLKVSYFVSFSYVGSKKPSLSAHCVFTIAASDMETTGTVLETVPHTMASLTLALREAELANQSLREENAGLKRKLEALGYAPPFRTPFAGEGELFSPDSILSHCYGALLPMFDTVEANTLRQLCREFKSTVADFPWEDDQTVIRGSVAAWRACFPRARWANVSGWNRRRTPVVDADFVHFVGLRRLDMEGCTSITDAAFVHLKGIHTLRMSGCFQPTITEAAFAHLKGIHTLDMTRCTQITDAAFVHLKGIHTLSIEECCQDSITDAAFVHLKGIHSLSMFFCSLLNITDAAFEHLKGIHTLDMTNCWRITDAAFKHLTGIHTLTLTYCETLTDAAFSHLKGIHTLNLHGCSQPSITDASFQHLAGIHSLCLMDCTQLTNAVFVHLKGVKRLNLCGCQQLTITDDFLKGIEWLCMEGHPQAHIEQAMGFGLSVVTSGDYFV
jgi:hypothetical protein